MNVDTSVSALHYDGFHNILHVDQGSKHVTLISPKYTEFLDPGASYSSSTANHSKSSSLSSSSSSFLALQCTLYAGDAVFIPEGWWHRIESQEFTVALNYWFKSPAYEFLHNQRQMIPYLLRSLALELTTQEVDTQQHLLLTQIQRRREKGEIEDIYVSLEQLRNHVQRLYQTICILEAGAAPSSVESEQWTSLVHIKTQLELEFVSCTLYSMKQTWLSLMDIECREEDEVVHKVIHLILLSLEPVAAYRTLYLWDSTDEQWDAEETRKFFDALLGLRAKEIQNYIVDQSDIYRRQVSKTALMRLNIAV